MIEEFISFSTTRRLPNDLLANKINGQEGFSYITFAIEPAQNPFNTSTKEAPYLQLSAGMLLEAKLMVHNAFSEKRLTFQLSKEEQDHWSDKLKNLELILTESGATNHPVVIYTTANTLFCEIGKSDRTFTIAIDDEGSTISYRDINSADECYKVTSWDGMPPLHDFFHSLSDFLHQDKPRAWNPRNNPLYQTVISSDDVFATRKATTQKRAEPSGFCKGLFTKTDLVPIFL